jgi:hypothetical protein
MISPIVAVCLVSIARIQHRRLRRAPAKLRTGNVQGPTWSQNALRRAARRRVDVPRRGAHHVTHNPCAHPTPWPSDRWHAPAITRIVLACIRYVAGATALFAAPDSWFSGPAGAKECSHPRVLVRGTVAPCLPGGVWEQLKLPGVAFREVEEAGAAERHYSLRRQGSRTSRIDVATGWRGQYAGARDASLGFRRTQHPR